jgi:hypothetical protein
MVKFAEWREVDKIDFSSGYSCCSLTRKWVRLLKQTAMRNESGNILKPASPLRQS